MSKQIFRGVFPRFLRLSHTFCKSSQNWLPSNLKLHERKWCVCMYLCKWFSHKKSKLPNLFSFIIRTLRKMYFIQNSNREATTEDIYKLEINWKRTSLNAFCKDFHSKFHMANFRTVIFNEYFFSKTPLVAASAVI